MARKIISRARAALLAPAFAFTAAVNAAETSTDPAIAGEVAIATNHTHDDLSTAGATLVAADDTRDADNLLRGSHITLSWLYPSIYLVS